MIFRKCQTIISKRRKRSKGIRKLTFFCFGQKLSTFCCHLLDLTVLVSGLRPKMSASGGFLRIVGLKTLEGAVVQLSGEDICDLVGKMNLQSVSGVLLPW